MLYIEAYRLSLFIILQLFLTFSFIPAIIHSYKMRKEFSTEERAQMVAYRDARKNNEMFNFCLLDTKFIDRHCLYIFVPRPLP